MIIFLSPKKMCVCLCLCVCLCVNKCVSMYVYACVRVCVCLYICVYVFVLMCVCFCVCVCAYIRVCVFVCKNVIHHRMALTSSSSFNLVIENIFKTNVGKKLIMRTLQKIERKKIMRSVYFIKLSPYYQNFEVRLI
jgi:hypothetical protein